MLDSTRSDIDQHLDNIRRLTQLAFASVTSESEGSLQKQLEQIQNQAAQGIIQLKQMQERRCLRAEANRRGNAESCPRGHYWQQKPDRGGHPYDEAYHLG